MSYIAENGSYELHAPPGQIPVEGRTIEYDRDLKPSIIAVGITPEGGKPVTLFSGESIAKYRIDYYELFKDIEPQDYDFIKFVAYTIPKVLKESIDDQSKEDKDLFTDIDIDPKIRDLVIKNVNHDIAISAHLKSAVILDSKHNELIGRKSDLFTGRYKLSPIPEPMAINHLIKIPAPNYSKMSIKDALELREAKGWRELRSAVTNMVSTIKCDPEIYTNLELLEKTVHYECDKAIMNELEKLSPSRREFVMDLALGALSFIPGISIIADAISAGKIINKYIDSDNTWYAFLLDLKRFK